MLRLAIVLLLALNFCPSQQKTPVPPAAAQKDAEGVIRSLFKDEYARRTPDGQLALAKTLLQQGKETRDDLTARYVLLREAADIAIKVGEFSVALDAAKTLTDGYDVNPVAFKTKLLMDAPATFRTPELARSYTELCQQVAGEAAALDRLEDAKGLLGKAEPAAKLAKDIGLVNRVLKQKKDLEAVLAEAQKAAAAEVTLQTNPDDPAANLASGRSLLAKGRIEQAIARLAKGSDPALKAAADKDLTAPKESQEQVHAGNGWWDAAEKEKEGPLRKALQDRAREWYESAYAGSTGLSRLAIEKRLDAIDKASGVPPPGPPTLRVIPYAEFESIAAQYPREEDLAAKHGNATASSKYSNRHPENVFKGNRRSDAWTLNTCPGWFEAKWDPPVRGRTLLIVGRNSPMGNDAWGEAATVTLNGTIKLPVKNMTGSRVIVIELGTARRLESLRIDITQTWGYPGMATLEIFR